MGTGIKGDVKGCCTAYIAISSVDRLFSILFLQKCPLNNYLINVFAFQCWLKPPDVEELRIESHRLWIWRSGIDLELQIST